MNIEIVGFYEDSRDDAKQHLIGTLHVYLIDEEIDLRGIYVTKKKESWWFGMPQRKGKDEETGKAVWYPTFTFTDIEKQKSLMVAIRKGGREYIEKHVLKKEAVE